MPSSSLSASRQAQYFTHGQKEDQKSVSAYCKVADVKASEAAYHALKIAGMSEDVTYNDFLAVYTLGKGEDSIEGSSKAKESRKLDQIGNNLNVGGVKVLSNERRPNPILSGMERKKGRSGCVTRSESQPSVDVENEEGSEGDHGKQKWKEVLDLLSERLVGRRVVARIRAGITQASLKGDDREPIVNPKRVAEKRRESLYRVLESVEKEWKVENMQVAVLDRRKRDLEEEVAGKRRLLLLLSVLEGMETARMRRIGSVGAKGQEKDSCGIGDLAKASR